MRDGVALSIAVVLTAVMPARAQDRLEPEDSVFAYGPNTDPIFDNYYRSVLLKFAEAYEFAYRTVVIPSFEPEYAIAFGDEAGTILVGLKANAQLWPYSLRDEHLQRGKPLNFALDPKNVSEVGATRCALTLLPADTALFASLWRTMLSRVKFPEKGFAGLDGVTYHFSGAGDRQSLAGKIWSPEPGTATDSLTRVADQLFEACSENDDARLAAARALAMALCEEADCPGENISAASQ